MSKLQIGELFAGIGGFGEAFRQAGAETIWAVEIDQHCQRVLRERFPTAQIESDVREVGAHNLAPVDVITFGSPCQDLSVAGRRKGFEGERSGLYYEAVRIIRELEPRYAIWENVPGALSSNGRRDFAAALEALVGCEVAVPAKRWSTSGVVFGPKGQAAWRILDAQYFGVAQRRKRLFVVYDPTGERAGEILFDTKGLYGDSPPSRPSKQVIAGPLTTGASQSGGYRNDLDGTTYIPELAGRYWDGGDLSDTLDVSMLVKGQMMPEKRRFPVVFEPLAFSCKNDGSDIGEVSPTLRSMNFDQSHTNGGGQVAVCYRKSKRAQTDQDDETWVLDDVTNTLNAFDTDDVRTTTAIVESLFGDVSHILTAEGCDASEDSTGRGTPIIAQLLKHLTIRRITPLEGLRLQGFPDGHLEVTGKPLSDTTKYRQIGNAVAVPCVRWIAQRMIAVHERNSNG